MIDHGQALPPTETHHAVRGTGCEPLRILVYTTQVRYPGGFENLALTLAMQLQELGHSVILLAHYSDVLPLDGFDCPPRTIPSPLQVESLEIPVRPSFASCIRGALRLRRLVKDHAIDVIEASGRGPSLLATFATIGLRVKVVIGVHEEKPQPQPANFEWWAWAGARVICNHTSFYAVSQCAADSWGRYTHTSRTRLAVVPNCIDTAFFAPPNRDRIAHIRDSLGCDMSERIILCAGRLMRLKAQDVVLEAVAPLLASYGARLVFVGRLDTEPGDDGLAMAELRDRVVYSELKSKVHFLGARQDMPDLMAAADVLVHVPRAEAFGLVLAEAMAIGVPIIASNVGGIPEVVAGTLTVVVPPCDPTALRTALEDYLTWEPEKRNDCIRVGRERAQDFHPTVRAKAMLGLISSTEHSRG
jgi:glycosyltransferase involved in cell wall biosynthesis